jgi:hypothetical protein
MKQELIRQILDLGIEISTTTNTDVWVDYAGHVNLLTVRVTLAGFDKNITHDKGFQLWLTPTEYSTEEEIETELKQVVEYLTVVKEVKNHENTM